jgi:hypothetical protein
MELREASLGVVKAMFWPRRPVMGEVEVAGLDVVAVVSSMLNGMSLARGRFRWLWRCSRSFGACLTAC